MNEEKGFTLVELLVGFSIIISITFFLAYLVFYQYWLYNTQNAEIDVTNNARVALSVLDDYIRESTSILPDYSTYQTGPQTLILQISAIDASNQIISGTFDTVVCYLSGTDLVLQLFPGSGSGRPASTKKIASNIDASNFSFLYDNAVYSFVKQVTTNLAITTSVSNQNRSITLSSKATLRNHQ